VKREDQFRCVVRIFRIMFSTLERLKMFHHPLVPFFGEGIAQYVLWPGNGLYDRRIGVRFSAVREILFFTSQRSVRIRGSGCRGLFPQAQSGRGVNLTAHFHLIPRLRMRGAVPSLPSYAFVVLCLIEYGNNSKVFSVSSLLAVGWRTCCSMSRFFYISLAIPGTVRQ
jgi:hypothetical protein